MAHRALVSVSRDEVLALREGMRDVQAAVADYYAETARGGDLGTTVRAFLVNTQTLNEQFSKNVSDAASYNALFTASTHSGVDFINAVKYARNVQQHVLHIVRPSDDKSLIGGLHGMRTYAFWDQIPQTAHEKLHRGTQSLKPAYDTVLLGQEVTQTMLEVLRFYSEVAPEIVHRDGRGEWSSFPLMNQPAVLSPQLHPEEPKNVTDAQAWLNDRVPNGDARVVSGQVTVNDVQYVVGSTFVGRLSFAPFVETVDQVNRDISAGFPYLAGEAAKNLEDATSGFAHAQGGVFRSRTALESWTSKIMSVEAKEDWCVLFDMDQWQHMIRIETTDPIPEELAYEVRRSRRLNAVVPLNH